MVRKMGFANTPSPRLMKDFVWLNSHCFEEALTFWEANFQQVRLELLADGPFDMLIAGAEVDSSRIYYVESSSTYRVRSCMTGSFISIAAILGGSFTLERGERAETGEAGTVFLLVPGVEISYVARQVRGIGARIGLHDISRVRVKALPHQKRTDLAQFFSPTEGADFYRLLSFLVSEIERFGPTEGPPPLQLRLLTQMLTERVSAHVAEALGPCPELNQHELEVVLKCESIIEAHPQEFFSVRELSSAVGWSERQIYRAFEGICDCTPVEFIRRSKLIRARGMMWNTHLPALSMNELALQIGYRNFRRFTHEMAQEFPEEMSLA